ncbi:MAG: hypothetical protein LAT76_11535 [Schleiferiaceae bacterium]|nr:hypothetical protein [Schleiferiaceae bacterium]
MSKLLHRRTENRYRSVQKTGRMVKHIRFLPIPQPKAEICEAIQGLQ